MHQPHVQHRRADRLEVGDGVGQPPRLLHRVEFRRRRHDDLERPLPGGERGRLLGALDHLGQRVVVGTLWRPAVAQLDGPPQRPLAAAADPQRHRLLDAVRLDDPAVETVVRSVVGGGRPPERLPDGAQRVVHPVAPAGERHADQLELFPGRAHADAEDQPAAADPVERAVALGDRQRMVERQHQHVGGEPDPLGARGEIAQGGEWVPVGPAAQVHLVRRDGDVLTAGDVVIAEALAGLRHDGDRVDPGVGLPALEEPRVQRGDR